MKFSYPLIKKLVPGLKNKRQLLDVLTMHSFEAEDAEGDAFEVALPPNRYSDASSHWGLAREVAAVLCLRKINIPNRALALKESDFAKLQIKILDKKLCPRYSAQCFEGVKVGESPLWMKKVLEDCGLRPINNVVDIMNYVMLETGQPLHAFDYDKLEGKKREVKMLVIRKAKKGERIVSLDKAQYFLTPDMLVIADARRPLAIAGIKGGLSAEVTQKTKRIVIESANFDPTSIYKTSRVLNLRTDASQRFSHNLSAHLASVGLERAAQLLQELTGARAGLYTDILSQSLSRQKIHLDLNKVKKLLGLEIKKEEIIGILERLNFSVKESGSKKEISLECVSSPFRSDIFTPEDIIEEIVRVYGYQRIKATAPLVHLSVPEIDRLSEIKNIVRSFLVGFGLDEVYGYSMTGVGDDVQINSNSPEAVEVANPISAEFSYLRHSILPGLLKSVEYNRKFFNEVKIFEIGRVFYADAVKKSKKINERTMLGIAISGSKDGFFKLKGLTQSLLVSLGISDVVFKEVPKDPSGLRVMGSGEYLGNILNNGGSVSVIELDLLRVEAVAKKNVSYKPIPKFPSVSRDVSFFVSEKEKIGIVIDAVSAVSAKLIHDIELIDEYRGDKWPGLQSLTLRIVFRSDDRTLKNEEVDKEFKHVVDVLQKRFKAKLR